VSLHKKNQSQKWLVLLSCFFALFMLTNSYGGVNAYDKVVDHPAIPLLDEQGQHVLQTKQPYSPKKSCSGSGCHDYEKITHAYHFEMGREESSDNYGAKRGLPHLVSPGYYGGYTCMGGSNPQVLAKKQNARPADFSDYGSAGWVKTCMDCHIGGGWAEKDRHGIRYDQKRSANIEFLDGDYYERQVNQQTGSIEIKRWDWKKSGVGEADCLFCHVKFSKLKLPADSGLSKALLPRKARTALVRQGFFRQAASGLLEYVKNTNGLHLLSITRKDEAFSLDKNGLPIFNWHEDAFDENGRVIIPMLRFPESDNCMACHLTSNTRRGFYGFGKASKATLATDGGDEQAGAGGTLEDDYRDDIHKGTKFTADNGERRSIESCNACHSSQYYKPANANIDLDANHNFPKGNSDMDVRNDLDYSPNVRSCELCHIHATNAVVSSQYDSLLHAHTERWKSNGSLNGYDTKSLAKITQTHFDVVSCQTCHIVNKVDGNGNELQIMYRYRIAEDGQQKIIPYNPRLRYFWKDKVSGHILNQTERNSIFVKAQDSDGNSYGEIIDPISGDILGRVSGRQGENEYFFNDPDDYESYKAIKQAYDSVLRKKGYIKPNVTMVWTESNEYIISHNTRAAKNAMPCTDCHVTKSNGDISQQIEAAGMLGKENSKIVAHIPDVRLVSEGIVSIGLAYSQLQPNGDITQNVADILFETRLDPFMSLLKNSSATEIIGEFTAISTHDVLGMVGPELATLLAPDFSNDTSFIFSSNKGSNSLRSMITVINGSTKNNLLLPTFRVVLGELQDAETTTQKFLEERGYGGLRSKVFYLEVLDKHAKQVTSFNGAEIYIKVPYKGRLTGLYNINIVVSDRLFTEIKVLPITDLVMLRPATVDEDGFVIFKMQKTGYFIISDKKVARKHS